MTVTIEKNQKIHTVHMTFMINHPLPYLRNITSADLLLTI